MTNEKPANKTISNDCLKTRRVIILAGLIGMLAWLAVFGIGMLVASQPYREQLALGFDWGALCKAIITFTPTNVAVLAMLGGFLGGCASLLLYADYDPYPPEHVEQREKREVDEERLAYLRENPISSALRGFAVYLTFLAGTVLGTNNAFATTTQDQYCRMAGAVALLAFAVGYDPTFFRQLISLVPRSKGGKDGRAPDFAAIPARFDHPTGK